MERFRVTGGSSLHGEVRVEGAKNSALKLMAASLLAAGRTAITNVPDILDVHVMGRLLELAHRVAVSDFPCPGRLQCGYGQSLSFSLPIDHNRANPRGSAIRR